MALKHLVLAVVADTPAHGYALHTEVLEALPTGRLPESARIYAILVGLAREGLVEASVEDAGRGRTRKRYRVTPPGRAELHRWLEHPRRGPSLLRRSLLARMALVSGGRRPGLGSPDWQRLVGERARRRENALRSRPSETRIARWVRLRETAHLDAELRVLRSLAGGASTSRGDRRPSTPPSQPFRDRS